MDSKPIGAGGNSFPHINSDKLFSILPLKSSTQFLDLACGYGDYAIEASKYVSSGQIYGMDLWEEGIRSLREKIRKQGINNIETKIVDITEGIPLNNNTIDICLISAVMHDFMHQNKEDEVLQEVIRILKPEGLLAMLEFKKKQTNYGPSMEHKISSTRLVEYLDTKSFVNQRIEDVGPDHYLATFHIKN